MTGWPGLDRLLAADPADGGCAHARERLHVYAELLDAGRDATVRHPAVAAHLAGCAPCADDLTGLLRALDRPGQDHDE